MYMSLFLKYTNQMSICTCFMRMEQLNSYLPLLPCLTDSDQAIDMTAQMNISFPEQELTVIMLRCMPMIYDDQFWLKMNFIPTALPLLCANLDAIGGAVDGTKLLKHKDEVMTSGRQRKKQRFTPPTTNIPSKNNDQGKDTDNKFCQRCQRSMGVQKQLTIPKIAKSTIMRELCLILLVSQSRHKTIAVNRNLAAGLTHDPLRKR